jgi:ATP adenylyltransferase
MLLVPRSREFFNSISINSLGFAGALLVRNGEQMDILKKLGPMTALKSVALPS